MTTTKRKTSSTRKNTKGRAAQGFTRAMGNVEDLVDEVSLRLWELTQ